MITDAQYLALRWLSEHSGDGVFDKNGVALCAGTSAPFMRATWNALRDQGFVEFYNPSNTGRGRLRITERGKEVVK
jgi:hypothetical protein